METLTGKDGIQIDDRVLVDLADGDAVTLDFPNDLGTPKVGKNGNIIYAVNESGRLCEVNLRLVIGSSDDKFINSRLAEFEADASAFILLTGVFTKRVGHGDGTTNTVTYECSGGVFKRKPGARTSSEGNIEQSVVVYTITFGSAPRSIE